MMTEGVALLSVIALVAVAFLVGLLWGFVLSMPYISELKWHRAFASRNPTDD